ncbi:MAG TPA: hypothetical protein VK858_17730 [Longimicrobiales bacterium]|nr:hypothetical protein [Longimicrobiales bacterium]
MNAALNDLRTGHEPTLARGIGLPGRVTVATTMTGGLLIGGVLVAAMTLTGQLSGHGLFMTSSGLFVVGALLGLVHGAVLGFLGREPDRPTHEATRAIALGGLYAVLGAAAAWLLTVWVAMTMLALYMDRIGPMLLAGAAWIGAAAVVAWTATVDVRALRNAYARWPDRVLGTALTAAGFAALLILFLTDRPEIWLTRFRVTEVGAVLLAGFATLWIVGPVVTLGLRLTHELPGLDRTRPATRARGAADVGIGLLVGAIAGLLAIPFTPGAAVTGAAGGVLVALSQVLIDETLLRLFLLTAVAWLILRWRGSHQEEAAVLAVITVAAAQVLIYLPGVVAVGFPSFLAAAAFTATAIVVPALLFGAVYWTRGFTAAVVADATAAAALVLLI